VSPDLHRYWDLDDRKSRKEKDPKSPPSAQAFGSHAWPGFLYLFVCPIAGAFLAIVVPYAWRELFS
jgi:hypothetical protein